jgi:hypothetical protein
MGSSTWQLALKVRGHLCKPLAPGVGLRVREHPNGLLKHLSSDGLTGSSRWEFRASPSPELLKSETEATESIVDLVLPRYRALDAETHDGLRRCLWPYRTLLASLAEVAFVWHLIRRLHTRAG